MTLLVALLSLFEFRKDSGVGLIRLGDDTGLPTEADGVSISDVAFTARTSWRRRRWSICTPWTKFLG